MESEKKEVIQEKESKENQQTEIINEENPEEKCESSKKNITEKISEENENQQTEKKDTVIS